MNGKRKPIYYWDSCIYIGWLKKEPSAWLDGAEAIMKRNYEKKNVIITSVITQIEVLESKLNVEQEKIFQELFSPEDHIQHEVSPAVMRKARVLRDHFLTSNPDKKTNLATPDAIHLATALIHNAQEFHTNDHGKKKEKETEILGTQGLIQLNGVDMAGEKLTISTPSAAEVETDLWNYKGHES